MRLYIEGHNHMRGYAISREWSDAECSYLPCAAPSDVQPVKYLTSRARAFHVVARWNRRFATQRPSQHEGERR